MKYCNFVNVGIYIVIQIAFFWNVSQLTTDLLSSLIYVLSTSEHRYSFWSFIVSCCSLILLLPNIASLEGLFRYGTSISTDRPSSQFPGKLFLYCSGSSFSELLRVLAHLFSEKILVSFISISNNNIRHFFPDIYDLSGNSWSVGPFSVF